MDIKVVLKPERRTFSFLYQATLLVKGLIEEGVNASLDERFSNGEVVLWYAPFRTPEFERPKRYGKTQVFFNPIDTNTLSPVVKERVKADFDLIITPSTHNYKLYKETGVKTVKIPHMVNEDDLPDECELREDTYYFMSKTFPIRRGTDIALRVNGKKSSINAHMRDHRTYLKTICKAGNFLAPVRGGAFEIEVLEALAMGMRVYYSEREIFDYITDIPPTFPVKGEYCKTEYGNDVFQTGCYDNVLDVINPKQVNKPNAKHYITEFSPRKIAREFIKEVEKVAN